MPEKRGEMKMLFDERISIIMPLTMPKKQLQEQLTLFKDKRIKTGSLLL